jgi:hypothetical protein
MTVPGTLNLIREVLPDRSRMAAAQKSSRGAGSVK